MNRDDIIRMARESRMPYFYGTWEIANLDSLERFAALVAAHKSVAWVGLTDNEADEVYRAAQEQINEYWESGGSTIMFPTMLYKAIETKLKEKNT
jgi:hypothetical protein